MVASRLHGFTQDSRILFVRTDAIGDAVLAADQLRLIHEQLPGASLAVACPRAVSDVYSDAPFPLQVLDYDPDRFRRSWSYRLQASRRIRGFRPTHVLNGMVTRTSASDMLTLLAGGRHRIGWGQSAARRLHERLFDAGYTRLLPPMKEQELRRNAAFLEELGFDSIGYRPRIWVAERVLEEMERRLRTLGLADGAFLVLFAGAQHLKGGYSRYGEALERAFGKSRIPVVAVGAAADRLLNQSQLDAYGGPSINLCGETTLQELAALIAKARLAFGADTGVSHVACAMGIPQVVLLGGGHFGRFHPYSSLTTLACLPLECYGCDWHCRYDRAHCIQDVPSAMLASALEDAWEAPAVATRIFYPAPLEGGEGRAPLRTAVEGLPLWVPADWRIWREDAP